MDASDARDERLAALVADTDAALALAGRSVGGVTEEQYWWEPVPDAWTVRRAGEEVRGVLPALGDWAIDGMWMYPDPPPFTTIAWRLNHMALVLAGYYDLLGPPIDPVPVAGSAAEAIETWTSMAFTFRAAIADLTPETATELVAVPHWGRSVERWTIVPGVLREQVHHGAEIGCLCDLHRHGRR